MSKLIQHNGVDFVLLNDEHPPCAFLHTSHNDAVCTVMEYMFFRLSFFWELLFKIPCFKYIRIIGMYLFSLFFSNHIAGYNTYQYLSDIHQLSREHTHH